MHNDTALTDLYAGLWDTKVSVDTKADRVELKALESRVEKLERDKIFMGHQPDVPFSFTQLSTNAIRVTLPSNDTVYEKLTNGTLNFRDEIPRSNEDIIGYLNSNLNLVEQFLYAETLVSQHVPIGNNKVKILVNMSCVMKNEPATFELIDEIKFELMLEQGKVE